VTLSTSVDEVLQPHLIYLATLRKFFPDNAAWSLVKLQSFVQAPGFPPYKNNHCKKITDKIYVYQRGAIFPPGDSLLLYRFDIRVLDTKIFNIPMKFCPELMTVILFVSFEF